MLAEKAITSCGYEINLLMLDMSKAFDTIQRGTLLNDLKEIIDEDELHLIELLLDKVNYSVKLEGQTGNKFTTNIGSPQGDGASALFFIIYLAVSLLLFLHKDSNNKCKNLNDHNYSKPTKDNNKLIPQQLQDHNYYVSTNNYFTIDQQYADDIGWASTGLHILNEIEQEVPKCLEKRNLLVNKSKTEKYHISRTSNNDWRKSKYVGSLLGTKEDILRRKILTNNAYFNLQSIFENNKVQIKTKLRIFSALLESIFLYNSEVWGTTKEDENKIDVFQRRLLRNVLGINWKKGNWISNNELYKITNQTPWSVKIAHRRLRFFGHIARLDDNAPAKLSLYEAIRKTRKPQGKPITTLLSTIHKQLKTIEINNFDDAINFAQDRENWRSLIARASFQKKT